MLQKAGYDPQQAKRVMVLLNKHGNKKAGLFRTHPTPKARFTALKPLTANKKGKRWTGRFQAIVKVQLGS